VHWPGDKYISFGVLLRAGGSVSLSRPVDRPRAETSAGSTCARRARHTKQHKVATRVGNQRFPPLRTYCCSLSF
jgi:hypothetical protein